MGLRSSYFRRMYEMGAAVRQAHAEEAAILSDIAYRSQACRPSINWTRVWENVNEACHPTVRPEMKIPVMSLSL